MRVALVCVHYPPLRSSCAIQMRDLAQELLLAGHEPIVLVPSEEIHKPWESETLNGVKVYRLSAFKTIDVNYFRRAINEMLLPFTMLYALRKSDFPLTKLNAIVWYSPTIFFGPLIKSLKRSSKCPSYLILRDIFPEWAVDLEIIKKGPIYYLFKLVAKYQYSVADIIGVQTKSNLKYLSSWSKKNNKKLEVLNNWLSQTNEIDTSISITNTCLKGRKIFVYIGNMGVAQGMDIIIDLAISLKQRKDIGFLFVGRGTEVKRLQSNVEKSGVGNILFHDEINSNELPDLLSKCHIGLVALDTRHKSHNIPGKFLTYLQAGLPVLAKINPNTDLVNLIEENGVGYAYVGNDIEDLKKLASSLIDNNMLLKSMSKRGRAISKSMFSSNIAVKNIIGAFEID